MAVSANLNNVCATTKSVQEKFPNRQIIKSTLEGILDPPMLTNIAIQAHIFPNIRHSLVSILSLFDAVCTVIFKTKNCIVVYKDEIILREWRNNQNKLWFFPLSIENEDKQVGEE